MAIYQVFMNLRIVGYLILFRLIIHINMIKLI